MPTDDHAQSGTNNETAIIKDLFGEILEARLQSQFDESDRVLREAKPRIREAVEQLLEAHNRASGVLLDDTAHPGTSRDASMPQPSPIIPGYEIGEEIGHGGFGIVYRARQRTPIDRPVAVKVLRRELVSSDAIARFRAESALLARMSHESIAKVHDAGLTQQGQPFVAMELIDGKPLIKACDELGLSVRDRVRLMASVCDAIHHAHQRAVIHRDLKPANVLVEALPTGPRARVIDFGIAKLLDADPLGAHTQASVRLGTPRYMSPEQREGGETADTRVDVYALGAMLCELLAGDVPTAGPTQSSDARTGTAASRITRPSRIASEQPNRTLVHPRTLRGDLDRIVLKACAADPDLRYPSTLALADDLRRYLQGRPVNAAPPSVWYVSRKFIRRHRASAALAAVLCIALLVTMGVAVLQWKQANEQRDRALASSERVAFIGDFLLDMLLLTADANARGAPPAFTDGTMQQIADRAAEGLDEDPKHMIDMLVGIGRFQAQAGQPEAGAQSVIRALDAAIDFYATPSPEVIALRVNLHDLLWGHGLEGWKEQIQLADEESAQLFGEDDPRRMRVVQRADGSRENLERIIARYEQLEGIEPADRYHALFAYSMLQRFGPTPEKQLETTARLYEVARESFPPDTTMVIDAMSLYGDAMSAYAPSEHAAELLLDAYERSTRVLGHDHYTTESIRRGLARVYGALGRPSEGIPYAVEDLESVARVQGNDSIQYANALYELGRLYQYAGQFDQARESLEQALTLKRTQWSAGHGQITSTQIVLAQVCHTLGNDERAEQLINEALPHLQLRRHAITFISAMSVRIAIRLRAGDEPGADALRAQTREHLAQLGMSPEEIESMLSS